MCSGAKCVSSGSKPCMHHTPKGWCPRARLHGRKCSYHGNSHPRTGRAEWSPSLHHPTPSTTPSTLVRVQQTPPHACPHRHPDACPHAPTITLICSASQPHVRTSPFRQPCCCISHFPTPWRACTPLCPCPRLLHPAPRPFEALIWNHAPISPSSIGHPNIQAIRTSPPQDLPP